MDRYVFLHEADQKDIEANGNKKNYPLWENLPVPNAPAWAFLGGIGLGLHRRACCSKVSYLMSATCTCWIALGFIGCRWVQELTAT